MKQYLVFAGSDYYPRGGWLDFQGEFLTLADAEAFCRTLDFDWIQLVDTQDGAIRHYDSLGNCEIIELTDKIKTLELFIEAEPKRIKAALFKLQSRLEGYAAKFHQWSQDCKKLEAGKKHWKEEYETTPNKTLENQIFEAAATIADARKEIAKIEDLLNEPPAIAQAEVEAIEQNLTASATQQVELLKSRLKVISTPVHANT